MRNSVTNKVHTWQNVSAFGLAQSALRVVILGIVL